MHIECTPEEVRTLIEEHVALDYTAATTDDVAEATDVLEGMEALISKLDPAIRYGTVDPYSIPVGDLAWIPVANNCTRSAGVAVSADGTVSFMVRVAEETHTSYFAARQAIAHALCGGPQDGTESETDCSTVEQSPRVGEDSLVALLKENGWAVAAGHTLDDVDDEILAQAYKLSEAGIAHLFATEAGDGTGHGLVLAIAGSTAGDRRRASQKLPKFPERRYSSRVGSVLFDCGEIGDHYSEQDGFGLTVKETPKPQTWLLDAAERFKASRFVRPSADKPLDAQAIRRRVRRIALVRGAVRHTFAVDPADAGELVRRAVVVYLIARYFSRKMVCRALDAERPWDSKAERGRMEKAGRRIRAEIIAACKARAGEPLEIETARELDAERLADKQARRDAGSTAEHSKLRYSIEGRRKSGRAAYDTARAVYVQRCPELEHKLLHLLRRDGTDAEATFLSRHTKLATEAVDPEGALRAALRQLAEAGKVRRVRSQKTGEVFLAATEGLNDTGYRRSLNGLIHDERYGIVNPWSETSAVNAEGEAGEWERGLEDSDSQAAASLASRRFRDTAATEQPLIAAEAVADYSATQEMEAIAEAVAEDIA